MSKMKNFIEELATQLGKNFEDVTDKDIQFHFMKKAQHVWTCSTDLKDRQFYKQFLPKISIKNLNQFDKIGDVIYQENSLTGDKSFYLVTE